MISAIYTSRQVSFLLFTLSSFAHQYSPTPSNKDTRARPLQLHATPEHHSPPPRRSQTPSGGGLHHRLIRGDQPTVIGEEVGGVGLGPLGASAYVSTLAAWPIGFGGLGVMKLTVST